MPHRHSQSCLAISAACQSETLTVSHSAQVAEQIDTATQVLLGLTDQPKWIAPFTFEDGFAWASKLAEFLIDTATHRYPSAFKEGLKPENPLKQEG